MMRLFRFLYDARLVLAVALFSGGALAFIETTLSPRIAENLRLQTYGQIPQLIDGAWMESTVAFDPAGDSSGRSRIYAARDREGEVLGWVVTGYEEGYAGPITVLVGSNPTGDRITGVHVLSQTETPGLGALVTEDRFLDNFAGMESGQRITVVKSVPGDAQVQAVTGATVSSVSVAEAVNGAMTGLRASLASGEAWGRMLPGEDMQAEEKP